MTKRIAVEEGMSDVRELLSSAGYQVLSLNAVRNADAVILTGLDNDVMGMEDIATKAPVIIANGKTPDEILATVQKHLS